MKLYNARMVWGVMLCFIGSLGYMIFQGGKLAYMLFMMVAILCFYLMLGTWNGIEKTKVTRTINNQKEGYAAGTVLQIALFIELKGVWPIPYIIVKDKLVHHSGRTTPFRSSVIPNWNRKGAIRYETSTLHRGLYRFESVECLTEDIFGLFQHRAVFSLPYTFNVFPKTAEIKQWPLLHHTITGHAHYAVATRALRETNQFDGVREYVYGDRMSRIHWNATARTGTLKSKEFEKESLPKSVFFLDRLPQHYRHDNTFELAVSIAASCLRFGAAKHLTTGLLSVGETTTYHEPWRGEAHYMRMGNHLLTVEADGDHAPYVLLQRFVKYFARDSFIHVISPAANEAFLKALVYLQQRGLHPSHLWILTDETELAQKQWMRQLNKRGIPCYPVSKLEELPTSLERGQQR